MWLVFSNHRGGEVRVVGKPSLGHSVVEGFGCGGSESGGSIKNEFSVLFMSDDVRCVGKYPNTGNILTGTQLC